MIYKKSVFFIICICIYIFQISTAFAQEELPKIKLKIGKHEEFYRLVFVFNNTEILQSTSVNILKDNKIKVSSSEDFQIEYKDKVLSDNEKLHGIGIKKFDKSFIFEIPSLSDIKVYKLNSPPRLVIDAYVNEMLNGKFSVLIDPGHGGRDKGLINNNVSEKDIVLYLSKEISLKLAQNGIKNILTRVSDEEVSLKKRIEIANNQNPSIFLSIHISQENLFRLYHFPNEKTQITKKLISNLKEKILKNFSEPVVIEEIPIYLINKINSPALLIEIPQKTLLNEKKYLNKIVDVLSQSLFEIGKANEKFTKNK
ncbi:N-acetylmuramoyl-L-alanine amidase [Thermodesulfovibrio sp. 1176]|uniref:N-acetylmuramoyl-L-alanine amidase n=1 Tax=Thermodesulfovibrio sp. 1176 TaxID=3043424 RepID=UPI002483244F|nr:N-acetylmuramoyl-L-alanine amidase [Thermodesulfovibrio sp. 1176]MDI1472615.1 N-acetylmuramoyl-L-alanine amidase [Thermodesulfovibrio sp. 1176]